MTTTLHPLALIRPSGESRRVVPAALFLLLWAIPSVVVLGVTYVLGLDEKPAAVVLASLGLVHSVLCFLRHGRERLSAPGIWMIGMAIFGFMPTLYYSFQYASEAYPFEVPGLALMFWSQLALWMWWRRTEALGGDVPPFAGMPRRLTVIGCVLGIGLLAGAAAYRYYDGGLHPLVRGAGYAGVVVTALTVVQSVRRVRAWTLLLVVGLFAAFAGLLFGGGGRLVLGTLAFALVLVAGTRWRPAFLKPLVVALMPPSLFVLANVRAEARENRLTGYSETGFESVVWPQRRFFDLVNSVWHGEIELGMGDTFFATAVAWFPRDLWAEKPVGFGTVLTEIYKPELLSLGHSEAALAHGEFMYNFGLAGPLVLVVVLGWGVLALDRLLLRAQQHPAASLRGLLLRAVTVIVVAGLLDMVWVGSFSWMERGGFTCAVLLAMYFVCFLMTPPQRTEHGRRLSAARSGRGRGHGSDRRIEAARPGGSAPP